MLRMRPRPEKLFVGNEGGFVAHALDERIPRIIRNVQADARWSADARARLGALAATATRTGTVDALAEAVGTEPPSLTAYRGRRLAAVPFFDFEFALYEAINTIVEFDGTRSRDPFAEQKRQAEAQAFAAADGALAAAVAFGRAGDPVGDALHFALRGNVADLSQTRRSDASVGALLADDTNSVLRRLRETPRGGVVAILLDNVGDELLADCILARTLIAELSGLTVELHAKTAPMFVSDALVYDYRAFADGMASFSETTARLSADLRDAEEQGRLRIVGISALSAPTFATTLPTELEERYASMRAVIAKGDLNYRRFLEDRCWPADTPVVRACAELPFAAWCLRVLKSEAVVGLSPELVARLETQAPDWRYAGAFAMLQWLGSEEGSAATRRIDRA